VNFVREMYGLLVHHKAAAVKIVALGDYTGDARRFAEGKPIELIHGGELIATVRSLQATKERATGPMDSPLALSGSMVASLLVIGVLSSASVTAPMPLTSTSAVIQSAVQLMPAPSRRHAATSTTHPQATIYMSDSQDAAQLREWKKQNAESMKILKKTTKEVPLR
jgi:restriction system protein